MAAISPAQARRMRDMAALSVSMQEYGTEIGRLFMAAKIKSYQYEVARRWARLTTAYHQAMSAPHSIASGSLIGSGREQSPDPESEAGLRLSKEERDVVQSWQRAHETLLASGHNRAVRDCCEHDAPIVESVALSSLRAGLDALALLWGVR